MKKIFVFASLAILGRCYFDNNPPQEIIQDYSYANINLTGLPKNKNIIFLIEFKENTATKQIHIGFNEKLTTDTNGSFIARYHLGRAVKASDSNILVYIDEDNNQSIDIGEKSYYSGAGSISELELSFTASFSSFKNTVSAAVVGPASGNPQYCVYLYGAFDSGFTANYASNSSNWYPNILWATGEESTNKNIAVNPDINITNTVCGLSK